MILLDTCALIDLVSPTPSLSQKTMDLIEQGSVVLSISFAEMACKIATGKLQIGVSIETLLVHFQETENVQVQDITTRMWLDAIELSWNIKDKPHKDPADRMILSYAESHELPIATTDTLMKQRYAHCMW